MEEWIYVLDPVSYRQWQYRTTELKRCLSEINAVFLTKGWISVEDYYNILWPGNIPKNSTPVLGWMLNENRVYFDNMPFNLEGPMKMETSNMELYVITLPSELGS